MTDAQKIKIKNDMKRKAFLQQSKSTTYEPTFKLQVPPAVSS